MLKNKTIYIASLCNIIKGKSLSKTAKCGLGNYGPLLLLQNPL